MNATVRNALRTYRRDVASTYATGHGTEHSYRPGLPNLILTDYLEFRWYVNGERRQTAHLAKEWP